MQACNVAGSDTICSDYTGAYLQKVQLPPAAPVLTLTSSNPSPGPIDLDWTDPANTQFYVLYESKDGGAATQKVITPPTSEYHIGRANGSYAFWVRACQTYEAAICSESNPVTVTVSGSTVPLPPASIQSSASGCGGTQNPDGTWQRTYTISWAASTGAVRYRVHEKKGPSPPPVEQYHTTPSLSKSFTGTHVRPLGGLSEWAYRVAACAGEEDTTCSTFSESVYVCVGPTQINAIASTTTYIHTDALRSPVAETSQTGVVTKRYTYEPYGAPGNGSYEQGPGYTGHVTDAATGLSYMQQRYFDPVAGRFLGIDPVTALTNGDMRHFSRYAYAYDNPYKFIDPDGRCPQCLWGIPIGAGINLAVQLAAGEGSFSNRWSNVNPD